MQSRHRRRFGTYGEERQTGSRILVRVVMALAAVGIAWYLLSTLVDLIGGTLMGTKATAQVTVRAGNVQVSLQDSAWQAAESGLRLGSGDRIASRGDGDAILEFFDGTRLRLDSNASVRINESDRDPTATSTIDLTLEAGGAWIASPAKALFTGAILRTIRTSNATIDIPSDTQALLTEDALIVLRADGIGLTLNIGSKQDQDVVVGEGQKLSLRQEDIAAKISGGDIYSLRDPLSQADRENAFLSESYALLSSLPGVRDHQELAPPGEISADETTNDLEVLSPDDNAAIETKTVLVTGKVSPRVQAIFVNGQNVRIQSDRNFRTEVGIAPESSKLINIEGHDAQGIAIARVKRAVRSTYAPIVPPVTIKSPVGSGQTLQTSSSEIEITGEAPTGTVAIMVNDYRLQLYKPGSKTWSYLASTANSNLREGENVYAIVALDADGRKSPARSLTISYTPGSSQTASGSHLTDTPLKQNAPLEPGSLMVTQPATGTRGETSLLELSLLGTTSPNTASISVNGYTLSLYAPGSVEWKYIASTSLGTMKRGRNVYRIVARNVRGEILDVLEYTLTFQP